MIIDGLWAEEYFNYHLCTYFFHKWWFVVAKRKTVPQKSHDKLIKIQRHHFADKSPYSQSFGFSSSHVWMWELDYKEAECQRTDTFKVFEKTLESPLDSKEVKPVNPKGNQSWIFIGRTDAEAEAPILWPSDSKNWLTGKGPDAWKDWGQEEKGATGDETVGRHHQLYGYELSKL